MRNLHDAPEGIPAVDCLHDAGLRAGRRHESPLRGRARNLSQLNAADLLSAPIKVAFSTIALDFLLFDRPLTKW